MTAHNFETMYVIIQGGKMSLTWLVSGQKNIWTEEMGAFLPLYLAVLFGVIFCWAIFNHQDVGLEMISSFYFMYFFLSHSLYLLVATEYQ